MTTTNIPASDPSEMSKMKKQTPIKIFLHQIALKFWKTKSKKAIMIHSIITIQTPAKTRERQCRTETQRQKLLQRLI